MSTHYSDPERESDPHALPDIEVFYLDPTEFAPGGRFYDFASELYSPHLTREEREERAGWYWWPCFPGCLPDSDPIGPFETEAEAVADAQADAEPVCDCKRSNGPYAECTCERGES